MRPSTSAWFLLLIAAGPGPGVAQEPGPIIDVNMNTPSTTVIMI